LLALLLSATIAIVALARGGLPTSAGQSPVDYQQWQRNLILVLAATVVAIPVCILLVSGFSVLPGFDQQLILIPESITGPMASSSNALVRGLAEFVAEVSRPAGLVLILGGLFAAVTLFRAAWREPKVGRQRLYAAFVLIFFSVWFWAFFEQSGSSVNNFTDRNVDRVSEARLVTEQDVGVTRTLSLLPGAGAETELLTQEYLGHENGADIRAQLGAAIRFVEGKKEADKRLSEQELQEAINQVSSQPKLTMTALTYLREYAKANSDPGSGQVSWTYTAENVGRIGVGGVEVPASVFQSVNSIYIMLFGLLFTALWGFLGSRGLEPSAPVKFALGLLQVGLGFAMLYVGISTADSDGMVGMVWLLLMYLLLTTGELCLSPVGLSMITQLSPKYLVSTVMGAWFLASAFSQFLAAIIAQYASVKQHGGAVVPVPLETVGVYGEVYKLIALMGLAAGVVCLLTAPLLSRWMHPEAD
jgi:POT family proton-dependent oligopeptide transporter